MAVGFEGKERVVIIHDKAACFPIWGGCDFQGMSAEVGGWDNSMKVCVWGA